MTVRFIYENPISITLDSAKDFGLLVNIKSMQIGLIGFFKKGLIFDNIFATVDLTIVWFYNEVAQSFHIVLAANLNFYQYNLSD